MIHTQVHYIGGTIAIAASCSAIKQNAECLMITNDNMAAFSSGITQNCHCSLLLHLAECLNLAAQQKLAALQNHVALQNLPAGTNLAAGPNLGRRIMIHSERMGSSAVAIQERPLTFS